jgi:hypothetical protein
MSEYLTPDNLTTISAGLNSIIKHSLELITKKLIDGALTTD